MTDLILHHFDASPFAEKIRKIFGVKGLAWKSVVIPMVMPKPDLTALTGGYRKTPVLQIGADIFCDTRLIAQVIDRLFPEPPLFSLGALVAAASHGWGGGEFFAPGAALSMHENRDHIPKAVLDDRRRYFTFLDFDSFEQQAPHFRSQLRAQARLIDDSLADGRPFLAGEQAGSVDIDAYFNIWMARANIASARRLLDGMTALLDWRDRMDALGEGERTEIDAADALSIARAGRRMPAGPVLPDESGARPGDRVEVAAADYGKDPVAGVLDFINDAEIAILREDPAAGAVRVRFPRIGFEVRRQTV